MTTMSSAERLLASAAGEWLPAIAVERALERFDLAAHPLTLAGRSRNTRTRRGRTTSVSPSRRLSAR